MALLQAIGDGNSKPLSSYTTKKRSRCLVDLIDDTPFFCEGKQEKTFEMLGDLTPLADLTSYFSPEKDMHFQYKPSIKVEFRNPKPESSDDKYLYYRSNVDNHKKLLMIRDSFAMCMIHYLSKNFSESIFNWDAFYRLNEFEKAIYEDLKEEKIKPDIVVFETYEKYIIEF